MLCGTTLNETMSLRKWSVITRTRPMRLSWAALAAGMLLTIGAPALAATPQASAKSRGPADRVMTRNELRACLKESDTLKADKTSIDAERNEVAAQKTAVLKERDDLAAEFQASVVALRNEREAIDVKSEEAVNAYNQKASAAQKSFDERKSAVDAKIDAWNKRNQAAVDRERAYNDAQQQWKDGCGSRRYREDDEKAIRAGK